MPISSENYKIIFNLLKKTYDNKLIISVYYAQNILKINSIETQSVNNISSFINTITSSVSSWKQ